MAVIEPATAQLMQLASELCQAQHTIRQQKRLILGLASALRAEQMARTSLIDLVDALLSDADG
jgi:hypothetical protein